MTDALAHYDHVPEVPMGRWLTIAERTERRPPVVAVRSYVCAACGELHEARAAQLQLGCVDGVAPGWPSPGVTADGSAVDAA